MLHRTTVSKSVNSKLKKIHSKHVIDTHQDFIKMPFTACIQGARGSGKTVACVQWVKHMEKEGYINRTFLLSPTAETNAVFQEPPNASRGRRVFRSHDVSESVERGVV
jgi:phage terminase large subunit-like protein